MRLVNDTPSAQVHRRYGGTFVFSVILAFAAWVGPVRMPLDFPYMLWCSLPVAMVWCFTAAFAGLRFRKRAFWLLVGAPFALYWPVWLLFNGIPECYWLGNCV